MTKIEGKTRAGDVIHQNLEMAKDVGFKCVARYWYDKTTPISEGIDQINDNARSRDDILCPIKHMGMGINDDNKFVFEYIDGREFIPTAHAMKQIANWCKVPQTFVNVMQEDVLKQNGAVDYKRDRQDAETLLNVLKNGYRRIEPDKNFRFRTYSDGTLRAMLSERYAIINNVWYLETMAELFKEIGGEEPRLSHWRGDADTIYGNILIPDTCRQDNDSDYGGMFSVSNCEIGIRRLSQLPSVFRAICMNGCIWDQEHGTKINQVHRGDLNLNDLKLKLVQNLHDQIPLLTEGVDRFLALRDKQIDKQLQLSKLFAQIADENALSFGQTGQIASVVEQFTKFEADNTNLFGVVNSITRAGQLYDPSEWVRFDMVAGRLMNYTDNQWEGLQARAKLMTTEKYNKVFGLVTAA